jgi:hypothetical protein
MQGSTAAGGVRATGVFAVTQRDLALAGHATAEDVVRANPGASLAEARRALLARDVAARHGLPFVQLRPPPT